VVIATAEGISLIANDGTLVRDLDTPGPGCMLRPVVHGAMADAIHPTRTGVGVRAQSQEVRGRR